MKQPILKIALSPFRHGLDYLLPTGIDAKKIHVGQRVLVSFRNQETVGLLVDVVHETKVEVSKLKKIISIIDEQPLFSEALIALIKWTADYYHAPISEVVACALPSLLRTNKKINIVHGSSDKKSPLELQRVIPTAAQIAAITAINSATGFQSFLIDGITGSGKTEVYLTVIEKIIEAGKQALVLVPEISLTPQTVARFRERFPCEIAIFHSRLTDKERLASWIAAQTGKAKIVIGTRSAIFTPLVNPGIIILDEEHDLSFKQQSGLRYSARDLALVRAKLENIPVVLGSATPSLESMYNAKRKRYVYLSLPKRAGDAQLPQLHLTDMRNQKLVDCLAEGLIQVIEKHLQQNGQVLLFINRRGYAPTLLCHACGWNARCNHCDVNLTLHREQGKLICHHCDFTLALPEVCPKCGKPQLIAQGFGTERLEKALEQIFPGVSVARVDRDSTKKKGSLHKLLEDVHLGKSQILVGTQMLAKGHHFPNVTLAAILNADSGLFSTDFRASEHLAQLIMQVSGRAGRERVGEVYIQTHNPAHPLLDKLIREGYHGFVTEQLAERKMTEFPPYAYLALIKAEAKIKDEAINFLQILRDQSELSAQNIRILGPIPATMERKGGKYRAQLMLQSTSRKALHDFIEEVLRLITTLKPKRTIKWLVDVDPVEVF